MSLNSIRVRESKLNRYATNPTAINAATIRQTRRIHFFVSLFLAIRSTNTNRYSMSAAINNKKFKTRAAAFVKPAGD